MIYFYVISVFGALYDGWMVIRTLVIFRSNWWNGVECNAVQCSAGSLEGREVGGREREKGGYKSRES